MLEMTPDMALVQLPTNTLMLNYEKAIGQKRKSELSLNLSSNLNVFLKWIGHFRQFGERSHSNGIRLTKKSGVDHTRVTLTGTVAEISAS